jgi:hypothetical protein
MKVLYALLLVIFFMPSCKNERRNNNSENNTPVALSNEKEKSFVYKRGPGDLIESLYSELVEQTPDLKKLENQINLLSASKNDSTEQFSNFDSKNEQYYESADRHLSSIKDSILKHAIKTQIENSTLAYTKKIDHHSNLMGTLEKRELTLNDLHIILKLNRTLPLIEEYQNKNLPGTASLEGIIKNYEKTIKQTNASIKQNKP